MDRKSWHNQTVSKHTGRERTVVQLIETIDRCAPETKKELAEEVDISEQYLSELLQDLKRDGIIKKSYVVDEAQIYSNVETISPLVTEDDSSPEPQYQGSQNLLELLEKLNDVTRTQYLAAHSAFDGDDPDESANQLEGLANERHSAMFSELKSYTLSAAWPDNRVAADLATMATNLEIVGDRACLITDVINRQEMATMGVVKDSILDIFEIGERINDHMSSVLFEAELERYDDLRTQESTLHRDLNELLELVTAYDPDMYGYLVTITRALERAIFYWVHTAELAVRLHSGRQPEHIENPGSLT
jgi:DNA-binding Lrp family transcriptional regulator